MKRPFLFILALAIAVPAAYDGVPAASAGNNFLDNLFSGGQRGRDRRAARAAATEQRRLNRPIQAALNYFGFDAGGVDGILGQRSRDAVSAYQALLLFPQTGTLTTDERSFLLESHAQVAENTAVTAGTLQAQEMLLSLRNQQPVAEVAIPEWQPAEMPSMQALCVNIGVDGAYDLAKAQFCNLRNLTITEGEEIVAARPRGITFDGLLEQCANFSDSMTAFSNGVWLRPATDIRIDLRKWARSTGMQPEVLAGIAKACLMAGFKSDRADISLASALTLTGLEQPSYIELTAYHLAFGLGVERADNLGLAATWLEFAAARYWEGGAVLTGQDGNVRMEIVAALADALADME